MVCALRWDVLAAIGPGWNYPGENEKAPGKTPPEISKSSRLKREAARPARLDGADGKRRPAAPSGPSTIFSCFHPALWGSLTMTTSTRPAKFQTWCETPTQRRPDKARHQIGGIERHG